RCRASISIDEVNVVKEEKFMPKGVYKATHVSISFNDIVVYAFTSDTAECALALAQAYMYRLRELPIDLSSREAIEQRVMGRKIWLRSKPVIVDEFDGMSGTIRVRPDFGATCPGSEVGPVLQRVDILSNE